MCELFLRVFDRYRCNVSWECGCKPKRRDCALAPDAPFNLDAESAGGSLVAVAPKNLVIPEDDQEDDGRYPTSPTPPPSRDVSPEPRGSALHLGKKMPDVGGAKPGGPL